MAASVPSFAERMEALLDRIAYRRALTVEQRLAIFRMRYDCYLREGAIDPDDSCSFADRYDQTANAILVGVFVDGGLASSIRLHVSTPDCQVMPATSTFPDLINPFLEAGERMVDFTRFVVHHQASRAHAGLAYLTLRVGWMSAERYDVDRVLCATRAEHVPFYRRGFGCDVISPVRHYPTLKKPVCLLSMEFRRKQEQIYRRYPFFMSTDAERASVFDTSAAAAEPACAGAYRPARLSWTMQRAEPDAARELPAGP